MSEPVRESSGIFVPLSPEALEALGNMALLDGKLPESVAKTLIEEGVARRAGEFLQEMARETAERERNARDGFDDLS